MEEMVQSQTGVLEHLFQRGDDGSEAVVSPRGEDFQGAPVAFYVEDIPQGDGFSVDMGLSVAVAVDHAGGSAESVDHRVLVNISGEYIHPHDGGVDGRPAVYDCDVEQPVCDGRLGGDIGVVAPLGGIADGYQEGFFGQQLAVGRDGIGLGAVLDIFRYGARDVAKQSAALAPGEAVAYGGVESHAERAEERQIVDGAVVGVHDIVGSDDFQCCLNIHRDMQMASQTVARSGGEDSQGCPGAAECAGGLVDGPVAAAGKYTVIALAGGLAGKAGGVAARSGKAHVNLMTALGHGLFHHLPDPFLTAGPGDGIDNKHQLRHSCASIG